MKIKIFLLSFILTIHCFVLKENCLAQSNETFSFENMPAGLPIVEIFTENGELPTFFMDNENFIKKNEYLTARIKKYNHKQLVYDSNDYVKDVSGGKIKVRGNASGGWNFPGYKLKFSKKVDFFNLGYKEREWFLIKPIPAWGRNYFLLDNVLGHETAILLGMEWQPNYELINLFINNDYRGLYYLTDAVEKNKTRCKIDDSGFLIENDIYWQFENGIYFHTDHQDNFFAYTFKYPDPDNVTDSIKNLYKDYINQFEENLYNGGDVSEYIDLKTWAAWLLSHDIIGSVDSWGTNMYLYKKDFDLSNPKSSKIKLGPLWDFDSSLYLSEQWGEHHYKNFFYFATLLKRKDFVEEYLQLWNNIKDTYIDNITSSFNDFVADRQDDIDQSIVLNNLRCDVEIKPINENIDYTLQWLSDRMKWIDNNIYSIGDISGINTSNITNIEPEVYSIDGIRLGTLNQLKRSNRHGIFIIRTANSTKKISF